MRPENVWDYPRPPQLEPVSERLRVVLGGGVVAETLRGWRVLETSHPPVYYLPRDAFTCTILPRPGGSLCEWKGRASYWSLQAGEGASAQIADNVAWSYPEPAPAFAPIRDHLAVYAGRVDACYVADERVVPQPGGFYGGWITRDLTGPFKGGPGTMVW